jgi:ubiquinone/menaquinone biosynthesis C-methylase UbiE
MKVTKETVPGGFDQPTALPQNGEQARSWQEANRSWWENHPMRYDWRSRIPFREFSREFYEEIDRRFFSSARTYMPWRSIPFDPLIDFDSLKDKAVLEIGVGSGSHAQLLAQSARSFTGIDLTEYAVKSTTARMKCFGLNATILRMDAENMRFADNSFDIIWTWGVIDHSANTRTVLQEMNRVLKPGGRAVTMVFHRSLWNYHILGGLFYGVLGGDFFKTRSIHEIIQMHADGGLARFYSVSEWRRLASEFFRIPRIYVYGVKAEMVPLPSGALKQLVLKLIPDTCGRFLTNRLRMGGLLVSILEKPL